MRLIQLNQFGFDHTALLVLFVMLFGVVGAGALVYSHAASPYAQLRLNNNKICLTGVNIETCNTTNKEMAFVKLTGSNFQIKDAAGYCIDDWNHSYQQEPLSLGGTRIVARLNTCYSGDKNQEWNWKGHELANVGNGGYGCLNASGASAKSGTEIIVYACNGQWNENWYKFSAYNSTSMGIGNTSSKSGSSSNPTPTPTTGGPFTLSWSSNFSSDKPLGSFGSCDENSCPNVPGWGAYPSGWPDTAIERGGY